MTSLIRHIDVDCADPYALAGFWSAALDYPLGPDDHPGDPEVVLTPPYGTGPGIFSYECRRGNVTNQEPVLRSPS